MHNRLQNHFRTKSSASEDRPTTAAVADMVDEGGMVDRATRTLAVHPAIAIGAAFAVGLLLGKWVKR